MKTIIVLAAHGAPATDCPRGTIGMFMALESMPRLVKRFGLLQRLKASLDRKVRFWPRTPDNDPYREGVQALAGVVPDLTMLAKILAGGLPGGAVAGGFTAGSTISAGGEIEAEGKVVPVRHAALGFPVGGTVAEVVVEEGEQVDAGQLLVRLDGSQQAAAVLLADADLRAAPDDADAGGLAEARGVDAAADRLRDAASVG